MTWTDEASAQLLDSDAAVEAAIEEGALTTEEPSIVVNMPLLTWLGGSR